MTIAIMRRPLMRGPASPLGLGALLLFLLTLTGCGVNNIPTFEEQAKAAWAQVQNQYQRRADLIPNLVETVKGAANFERETLQAVIEARSKVAQTTLPPDVLTNPDAFKAFEANQGALTSALSRLMVVVERYPDLKANQNFLALQSQLEGTENRISVARRDYIEAVRVYNTELRTFPGRLWAMTLYSGHQPMQSFSAAEGAQTPPAVKF
ncbi:MAG: LemA family protein [Rhodospirillales bacterium]|nr:LemA family protein [Rhodospirillales bacterium]